MEHAADNLFDGLVPNTHSTLQEQVRRHLRQQIVSSGKLQTGQQIPTMRELAKQCRTNVQTIHQAITALVREGLLTSVPGVGTFVSKPEAKLTRMGLVYAQQIFAPGGSEFVHSIHTQLQELLEAQGVEVSIWVDARPVAEQNKPWDVLRDAAAERKIQGMIVPQLTLERLAWMEKLPIPSAYLFSQSLLPNTVHLDLPQFIDLSLERLVSQGCRSVGMIYPRAVDTPGPAKLQDRVSALVERFVDRATDLGLKVRNEWVRLPKEKVEFGSHKAFGYQEFHDLWAQPQRPEGMVVFDDVVMRGVITAVLEARIDVPRELKIVSAKIKYVELFSPFPISHVVLDEREIAKVLIELVQAQFRGDRCGVNLKWIGYTLAPEQIHARHQGSSMKTSTVSTNLQ